LHQIHLFPNFNFISSITNFLSYQWQNKGSAYVRQRGRIKEVQIRIFCTLSQ
jgi:hypothetical protein